MGQSSVYDTGSPGPDRRITTSYFKGLEAFAMANIHVVSSRRRLFQEGKYDHVFDFDLLQRP